MITQTEFLPIQIPDNLRQDCLRYYPNAERFDTVGDIVESRAMWRKAAERCAADHLALIEATAND